MRFECDEFEVKGPRGQITAYGLEWSEARTWAERFVLSVAILFYNVSLFIGFLVVPTGFMAGLKGGVPMALGAAAAYGLTRVLRNIGWGMAGKPQSITFGLDGTISTSKEGKLNMRFADIRSIEWEQVREKSKNDFLPYTHGVRVITRRGYIMHLAKNLAPDQATQLSMRLNDLWESMKYEDPRQVVQNGHVTVW